MIWTISLSIHVSTITCTSQPLIQNQFDDGDHNNLTGNPQSVDDETEQIAINYQLLRWQQTKVTSSQQFILVYPSSSQFNRRMTQISTTLQGRYIIQCTLRGRWQQQIRQRTLLRRWYQQSISSLSSMICRRRRWLCRRRRNKAQATMTIGYWWQR